MKVTAEVRSLLKIGEYLAKRNNMSATLEPCFNDLSMNMISKTDPDIEVMVEYFSEKLFTVGFYGLDGVSSYEDFKSVEEVCEAATKFIEREEAYSNHGIA